jgi:hypothetical protein
MIDNLLSSPMRRLLNWRADKSRQHKLPIATEAQSWRLSLRINEVADRYLITLVSLAAGTTLALIFAVVLSGQVQQIALFFFLVMLVWTAFVGFSRVSLLKLSNEISTLTLESERTLVAGSAYLMRIKSTKGVFAMSREPQFIWKMKTIGGPHLRVLRGNCQIKKEDLQSLRSVYYCEGILPKDAIPTDEASINVYAEFQLWVKGFKFSFLVPISRPGLEVGA